VEAAKYARETYPAMTTAAFLYRNDDSGRPNRDGFRDTFDTLGGTVQAEGSFILATSTVADFKALLRTVTAGNPSIIAANPNVARVKLIMQAYVELRDDPTWTAKPPNFDSLRFIWSASATGSFSDMSATALTALVNQAEAVQGAWNPDSVGFQKWFALYRAFNPDAQPPTSSFPMSAYDATIVMALAITAAGSTNPAAIAAKLREVTNPPGKCVYPGEWRKAFRFLAQGKNINYEGALGGPVDLDERGNATGSPHGVFRYLPDGSAALVRLLTSATQSVCEPDEDD
jgi:branched-chain amino acid transport system substrate-binding protein